MEIHIDFVRYMYLIEELWIVSQKRGVLAEFHLNANKALERVLVYQNVTVAARNAILQCAVSYADGHQYNTSAHRGLDVCKPGISFTFDALYLEALDSDALREHLKQRGVTYIEITYYSVQDALRAAFSEVNLYALSYRMRGESKMLPDQVFLNCTVQEQYTFTLWDVLENDYVIPEKHPLRLGYMSIGSVNRSTNCYIRGRAVSTIELAHNLYNWRWFRRKNRDLPYVTSSSVNIGLRASYLRTHSGVEELVYVLRALLMLRERYIELS